MGKIGIMGGNALYSSGLTNLPVGPGYQLLSRQKWKPERPSISPLLYAAMRGRVPSFVPQKCPTIMSHIRTSKPWRNSAWLDFGGSAANTAFSFRARHFLPICQTV